jgi:hypothetical protein
MAGAIARARRASIRRPGSRVGAADGGGLYNPPGFPSAIDYPGRYPAAGPPMVRGAKPLTRLDGPVAQPDRAAVS